jgi:hypothetical protein
MLNLHVATTRRTKVSRRPQLLILAAFTPYIGTALSLRVEHFIVYGSLLVLVISRPDRIQYAIWHSRRLLIPWLLVAALIVSNLTLRVTASASLTDFATLERILRRSDSFLLQAAAVLIVLATMSRSPNESRNQIRIAAATFVTAMCANSILIVAFDPKRIEHILKYFWTNPAGAEYRGWLSVAARELTAGRYGGIFNQPFDGGLAYALALIAWWYLSHRRFERSLVRAGLPMAGLALLIIGGLSTGSKVFIAGIFLAIGLVILTQIGDIGKSIPRYLRLAIIATIGTAGVVWVELVNLRRFWRFVDTLGSDTAATTGGRFQSLGEYWYQILDDLSFLGKQGFYTDDAIRSYLTSGGIIGLFLVVLVYRELFGVGRRLPQRSPERWLALGLASITLAASLGSISLQTIRASSVFWILMALLLGHGENLRRLRLQTVGRTVTASRYHSGLPQDVR